MVAIIDGQASCGVGPTGSVGLAPCKSRLGLGCWSEPVGGAADSHSAAVQDMEVDHGGLDIFVSHEFRNGSDVVTGEDEFRGEGVA